MISISAAVSLIITLIIAGLIFGLLYWLIGFCQRKCGAPPIFSNIAYVILAILGVLVLIGILYSLISPQQPIFRP
jgi:predicted PurR-regulated permease PerM